MVDGHNAQHQHHDGAPPSWWTPTPRATTTTHPTTPVPTTPPPRRVRTVLAVQADVDAALAGAPQRTMPCQNPTIMVDGINM